MAMYQIIDSDRDGVTGLESVGAVAECIVESNACDFGHASLVSDLGALMKCRSLRVPLDDVVRVPLRDDFATLQQENALAYIADGVQVVRDEHHRGALAVHFRDALLALFLKRVIADRQYLIQQQNVRIEVGSNRKPQPNEHAGRKSLNGDVDKGPNPCKFYDAFQLACNLGAAHSPN